MGGRSKSRSSNTSGQTQSTMNNLAKGRVSNSSMMDLLSQLQNSQMSGILPIFDALMQNGNNTMGSNPMMQMFGGQQQAQHPSLADLFKSGPIGGIADAAPTSGPGVSINIPRGPASDVDLGLLSGEEDSVNIRREPRLKNFAPPVGQSGVGAMPNMTPDQMGILQKMAGYGRR